MARAKSIPFFAVGEDLASVLLELEASERVHYCKGGWSEREEPAEWNTVAAIPSFGIPTATSTIVSQSYLIAPASEPFRPRRIDLKRGGIRWAMDQAINPASVAMIPGGHIPNSNIVLAGQCGTITASRDGAIWRFLKGRLRRWERVQSYRVSPTAGQIFAQGYRFTSDTRDPSEYDLRAV